MKRILTINGGMGKSVFATALCNGIKKAHPNDPLYVATGYPDVFSGIESVDMALSHGHESYFYERYIADGDFTLYANEPYLVSEHVRCSEHVLASWFRLCGIDYAGQLPQVNINYRENLFYSNKFAPKRQYMVIQSNGGPAGDVDLKYSWARDIPTAVVRAVVEEFSPRYDIYHIRKDNQLSYERTIPVQDSYKAICWLLKNSDKRLLMDSFCQHAAAGMGKRSTVLWIANKPNVFGYEIHDNVVANPETRKPDLRSSFLSKYNISGAVNEFPYNDESEIFDVNRIIDSIKSQ